MFLVTEVTFTRYTPYFFDKAVLDNILEESVDQHFDTLIQSRHVQRRRDVVDDSLTSEVMEEMGDSMLEPPEVHIDYFYDKMSMMKHWPCHYHNQQQELPQYYFSVANPIILLVPLARNLTCRDDGFYHGSSSLFADKNIDNDCWYWNI